MTDSQPPFRSSARPGYTLPVFACAAAIAALYRLQDRTPSRATVPVNLLEPAETVEIPIEQVARLSQTAALAIARSDPGDNLDLTRHTPIWALVEWGSSDQAEPIVVEGGEGIGRRTDAHHQAAIYAYAQRLFQANLTQARSGPMPIRVTIILPEGRALAERTSNAAFGVVEGLSLLGTSGIAQPLSAPGQLEAYRETLCQQVKRHPNLVFCIGENGLDRAQQLGIERDRLVKTANWLGPLLVEAALQGAQSVLLWGYHGKLIKLAGGIFHTHHHVADGRQEILAAHSASQGVSQADVQILLTSPTTEAALKHLRQLDTASGSDWVNAIYGAIARQIDQRTQAYIHSHSATTLTIGSVLFDRDRQVIIRSPTGSHLMTQAISQIQ